MAKRKPKIVYYWSAVGFGDYKVNWRLVGANGEIMCHSTQGSRDKTDAQRAVGDVITVLMGESAVLADDVREVGPGRKPA